MTLKYESEILFELMKRDGDDAPSDVLPYESELKEKYLNQVVGAYPKLQDYQPEWLNYNLYRHLPSDFPVESVANVTSASFNNVVPYAYKSAILKGNTMVNLCQTKSVKVASNPTGDKWTKLSLTYDLPVGKYLFVVNGLKNSTANTQGFRFGDANSNYTWAFYQTSVTGKSCSIMEFNTPITSLHHYTSNNESEISYDDIMIIEYQQGMENWDIPYFEGMQSVKMPVLTTTGKNLVNCDIGFDELFPLNAEIGQKIYVSNNTQLRFSYFDKNKNKISHYTINSLNTNTNRYEKTIICETEYYYGAFMKITTTTSEINEPYVSMIDNVYEPYKSNILTVNEEVEFRGIGDVQDTLNCLTGEVTERIGEIVLDGSENWVISGSTRPNHLRMYLSEPRFKQNQNVINNRFADNGNIQDKDIEGVYITDTIDIQVEHSRLSEVSVNGFKNWLRENNIKVQAILSQESIKTVDLTVTDQDGNTESIIRPIEGTMHVSTSSQTLPPLLDMSVPVEATSQNLMSFANIVEEEK